MSPSEAFGKPTKFQGQETTNGNRKRRIRRSRKHSLKGGTPQTPLVSASVLMKPDRIFRTSPYILGRRDFLTHQVSTPIKEPTVRYPTSAWFYFLLGMAFLVAYFYAGGKLPCKAKIKRKVSMVLKNAQRLKNFNKVAHAGQGLQQYTDGITERFVETRGQATYVARVTNGANDIQVMKISWKTQIYFRETAV